MPRPPNTIHNASSLREFAKAIRAKAKQIEELAGTLEQIGGPMCSVQVAHQRKVDQGVTAMESMRLEILRKINQKETITVEVAIPPAAKKRAAKSS